ASSGGLGWYLGKYLAKRQDQRMARGYRRWTRARAFASSILMRWRDPAVVPSTSAPQNVRLLGWRHPFLPVMVANRVWPAAPCHLGRRPTAATSTVTLTCRATCRW